MDEDELSSRRKDQVGAPGEAAAVEDVAIAERVGQPSHAQLGAGVARSHGAHAGAALARRQHVGHGVRSCARRERPSCQAAFDDAASRVAPSSATAQAARATGAAARAGARTASGRPARRRRRPWPGSRRCRRPGISNVSGAPMSRAHSRTVIRRVRTVPLSTCTTTCRLLPPSGVRRHPATPSKRISRRCAAPSHLRPAPVVRR